MIKILKRNNENIDFENIELKIEKNIREKENKFEYDNNEIDNLRIEDNAQKNIYENKFLADLIPRCDIKINRTISSHRPVVGGALVKVRKFLDEEIRRSIDPAIDKQVDFNKKLIEQINNRFNDINNRFDNINSRFEEIKVRFKEIDRHIDENIKQTNSNIKEVFKLKKKIEDGN